MGVPTIFISHAYKDKALIDAFAAFLARAGIPEQQIVCSSSPGTQLHTGKPLYSELRNVLLNDKVFVFFMLSKNFYSSVVCLNEMGAAWIQNAEFREILLPGFAFEQKKGVICEKGLLGIALDTYDESAVEQFNYLRNDLSEFGFHFSLDKWDIAIREFYRAVEAYKKKLTDAISLNMKEVKSYCIGDCDNDGCQIIKKASSEKNTVVTIDFEKTDSKLCSIVYRVEEKDWSLLDIKQKKLCFDIHSNIDCVRSEVEIHLSDRDEPVPIFITDDAQSFSIPLEHFSSSMQAWKKVSEVCFLFRKKYISNIITITIENLHLE